MDKSSATEILLDIGWARITNGTVSFSIEIEEKISESQEKVISEIIEYQHPEIIYIDNNTFGFEEFTLEQVLNFLRGIELNYRSDLSRFR